MRLFHLILSFGGLLGMLSPATAGLLNVQFQGQRGAYAPAFTGNGVLRQSGSTFANPAASAGDTSGIWNGLQVPSATPNNSGSNYVNGSWTNPLTGFQDAGGTSTGVTLALANFTSSDSVDGLNTGYDQANPLYNGYLLQVATGTHFGYVGAGAATLTIGGLSAGSSYDLYLYASNAGDAIGGVFSVNGSVTKTSNGDSGSNTFATTLYSSGVNYVVFSGITANGSGNLVITETEEGSSLGVLNGFQLQGAIPVPEPNAITLGFSGMLGLAFFVRNKRRR